MAVANGGSVVVGHTAKIAGGNNADTQILGTAGGDSGLKIGRWSADATGPGIELHKSRNATIGSSTIVQDNDALGDIVWYADDGGDLNSSSAYIRAEVDGAPGANDVPGALTFGTTADGASSGTERMRIASDGILTVTANTGAGGYVAHFINDGNVNTKQGMKVQAGADDGSGETVYFLAQDGDGGNHGYLMSNNGTFQLVNSSDERGKVDIVDTTVDGLATINAVEVKDFTRKKSGDRVSADFVAQQMLTAFSAAVHQPEDVPEVLYTEDVAAVLYEEGDELPEGKSVGDVKTEAIKEGDVQTEGYTPWMAIGKDSLIGPLVKAVQQLSAKITAQEAEIAILKG
jgi:hypothetical protein